MRKLGGAGRTGRLEQYPSKSIYRYREFGRSHQLRSWRTSQLLACRGNSAPAGSASSLRPVYSELKAAILTSRRFRRRQPGADNEPKSSDRCPEVSVAKARPEQEGDSPDPAGPRRIRCTNQQPQKTALSGNSSQCGDGAIPAALSRRLYCSREHRHVCSRGRADSHLQLP